MPKKTTIVPTRVQAWTLSPEASFGSAVRAKGILLEIRARLPVAVRKSLDVEGMILTLALPEEQEDDFVRTSSAVSTALIGIEELQVIPREIQDILGMTASERHRWLADGRLQSAGTRTVRLAGRARQITFHVFDPKVVEDLLDRGAVDEWRVEDAEAKAEKRAKAAYQAKLTRMSKKSKRSKKSGSGTEDSASGLRGWEDFDLDGLLR
ncbi:hypothetical protein DEM27_20215 [Metarhizobium album]|uniref:Uncharacterized protein n=1 Tax=Metarhizobium album TaxID=2182425 RepID=A0A2U2DMQ8_9HYPH|nr:hypothetical protein [Rhizobium album]PWE54560.1 hypothetical protein DEM27_20215 [Rhizobium album]